MSAYIALVHNRCPQEYIAHAELERFQQDYVSLFRLAEERRQHFSRVLKDLDSRGIEPAFRLEKIGARFYARQRATCQ